MSATPSATMPLGPSLLCMIGSVMATSGSWLDPPPRYTLPIPTQYTGTWSFLTFQTNVLSAIYFGVCTLCAAMPGSALEAVVIPCYPVVFALDFLLTPLYYGLDHFNMENVKMRQKWMKKGYRMDVTAHLNHAPGAAIALVAAFSMRESPSAYACTVGTVVYLIAYLSQTFLNRWATGAWVYPVLEDVQRVAGLPGVGAFIFVVCAVGVGLAHLGKAIVDWRLS